jgi:tungstate transport system permease protein
VILENVLPVLGLSLAVSLAATAIAASIGVPLAAALALHAFRGRHALVVAVNALLGLPPVVVGLAMYLLLSRTGPLGWFGLLFTPPAMVIAQAVLATPIIAALSHRALEAAWRDYGPALRVLGATPWRALPTLLAMQARPIATALLAGFGRTISEVGAVLIVGGNIAGYTRTMTTTVALETSKGNLDLALAIGLCLVAVSLAISTAAIALGGSRP